MSDSKCPALQGKIVGCRDCCLPYEVQKKYGGVGLACIKMLEIYRQRELDESKKDKRLGT